MDKHTKGPESWTVGTRTPLGRGWVRIESETNLVATARPEFAKLIARAPDLLAENERLREALQSIADYICHVPMTDLEIATAIKRKARAALKGGGE